MDLSGVPTPKMDWTSAHISEEWKNFKQHAELIFKGPLADKDEQEKCSYLLLWIGDKGRYIYNTWTDLTMNKKKVSRNTTIVLNNTCNPR